MTKKSTARLQKLLEQRQEKKGKGHQRGRMRVHTHKWFQRRKRLAKIAEASRKRNRK